MSWTEKVQTRLVALGFDPGPVDGDLGPRTRAAIHAAQSWHKGVADTDNVDAILWPHGQISDRIEGPSPSNIWPTEAGVPTFYGEMGRHLTTLELPFPMRLAWDLDKVINRFSIHEKCHDSAKRCFERIADAYPADQRADIGIDLFGGCLSAPRKKRGGSTWSMHSWGIAIDFDPARNQLKWGRDRARLARPDAETFWRIWEEEGWVSLGRARNYDWMHVQAARL